MIPTPYYLFDADGFIDNYKELVGVFRDYYPNYQVAYSFKTNYTPAICKIIFELGGYAEVVSDMEYELAKRVGFPVNRIIYNGPGKGMYSNECILNKGSLNVDNLGEVQTICDNSDNYRGFSVGIRVNFDIGNGLHSRFGIDAFSGDIEKAIDRLKESGLDISGIHFHISRARDLDSWKQRIETLLDIADRVENRVCKSLNYIDIGSGMFGKMADQLSQQFQNVPSYRDYARTVAGTMANHYLHRKDKPILFTEPGTTLVSRYLSLFSKVLDIKTIRDKNFALLDCSFHNVGEICALKKVPMEIVKEGDYGKQYSAIDLVGYTCLEQDVIYRDYCGRLGTNDIVRFDNVGGYSIVNKPPFIHPDIPVYMMKNTEKTCIKRAQTFDDIFAPYVF